MSGNVFQVGGVAFDPAAVLFGLAGLAALVLLVLLVVALVHLTRLRRESSQRAAQAAQLETELTEMKGRLQTVADMSVSRQSELGRSINERLDQVSHRLGQNLNENARKTSESLSKLNERLAVIDTAQKNITELSSNVVTLQNILSNKQQRGAFGQGRMETIIEDSLPRDAFSFQATLSNGNRPDCVIHLPNAPDLVIDAKFPLEGFEALREAATEAETKQAVARVRQDVGAHITAISGRYFIASETQDQALMFVPSEAVYAELHERFPDLLQKASRARIVIVSPNMLMLAVQTMQAIMKDVKMREQAGMIQKEVTYLMEDVHRLHDRVLKLQQHFGQAGKDIELVLTSSQKITSRGRKIETLDFDDKTAEGSQETPRMPASTRGETKETAPANGKAQQQNTASGSDR